MSTSSFLKLLLLHIYPVITINERTITRYTEAVQERVYLTRSILAVGPELDSMAKSHSTSIDSAGSLARHSTHLLEYSIFLVIWSLDRPDVVRCDCQLHLALS